MLWNAWAPSQNSVPTLDRGYRDERLLTWRADEQPGAEERDRAEGRHVEPSRLQGA